MKNRQPHDAVTQLSGAQRWNCGQAQIALEAQQASGLTVAEFARRHGIRAGRLYAWRYKPDSTPRAARLVPVTICDSRAETQSVPPVCVVRLGGIAIEALELTAESAQWVAALARAHERDSR